MNDVFFHTISHLLNFLNYSHRYEKNTHSGEIKYS